MKIGLLELAVELEKFSKYPGRLMRHKKTGREYVIDYFHIIEETLKVGFTYHPRGHIVTFQRPIEELFDGRFEIYEKGKDQC